MINQLFTFSSTIERLRQGPLSEHLDAYAVAVAEQGYTHDSIRQQILVIADFSRLLKQKHIDLQALNSKLVDRFLRLRRRQQRIRRGPDTFVLVVVGMAEPSPVANDRVITADGTSTRQEVQRDHPGSALSSTCGSAIKRITAGVKAAAAKFRSEDRPSPSR